jgi:hypothetical protein
VRPLAKVARAADTMPAIDSILVFAIFGATEKLLDVYSVDEVVVPLPVPVALLPGTCEAVTVNVVCGETD